MVASGKIQNPHRSDTPTSTANCVSMVLSPCAFSCSVERAANYTYANSLLSNVAEPHDWLLDRDHTGMPHSRIYCACRAHSPQRLPLHLERDSAAVRQWASERTISINIRLTIIQARNCAAELALHGNVTDATEAHDLSPTWYEV